MKKIIFIGLLLLTIYCLPVVAQEEISLPRDVAETALAAVREKPALEKRIITLEAQNLELERSKMTPCTLAQEKVRLDLSTWLVASENAGMLQKKEIIKILKMTRKMGERSIRAQCGIEKSESAVMKIFNTAIKLAPFAVLAL